jgi:hypothetical protein
MKAPYAIGAALAVALVGRATADQCPYDGYAFWLPCGELKVGDAQSEKDFQFKRSGAAVSFVIHPRRTRFDVPKGQMVVVVPGAVESEKAPGAPRFRAGDTVRGRLECVTFLPREPFAGVHDIPMTVPAGLKNGSVLRFYWTDDSDKLGTDLSEAVLRSTSHAPSDRYLLSVADLIAGKFETARAGFLKLAAGLPTPEARRLCRRMARWCDAEIQFKKIRSGPGFYNLGLYCMVGGLWELAEDSFRKATQLMPQDGDAAYMLADAVAYVVSDLDTRMELVYPYYKHAAELYRKPGATTFRTFFALCRNLKVKEGDHTVVKHITDEEIAYVEKAWSWCSAIMEGASKGALRMVDTFKVYDQEFDGTDDWNSRPFNGLFQPGTVDTFIKMTDWGASDTCGMDCGPDRSAFINLGIREWDVMLHEWNHSLDWEMVSTELGIGVPETHASDWAGYEPLPSMGMGHHSINRYYMTPGMYRIVRGSDPATTPYVTDWAVSGPYPLVPAVSDVKKIDDAYGQSVQDKAKAVLPPRIESLKDTPKVDDGYVDLRATWPEAQPSSYGFAKCYVYSPQRQKVRMWLAADDNVRVWLNGKLVHKGLYWCCAKFHSQLTKDQLSSGALLEKGWNSLMVQISCCQHGPDPEADTPDRDRWGFSVRFCTTQNEVVPGLRWQAAKPAGFKTPVAFPWNPKNPKTYSWRAVADDYTSLLPALTLDDLRAVTGYKTLTATNDIFFDLSREKLAPELAGCAIPKVDLKNVQLNNELNWDSAPKEDVAVIRYRHGGKLHDLVFLRPEGYEPFLRMMRVTPEAKALGIRSHLDRVIGYFTVPKGDSANGRIVLVVDTYLGDKLPVDEEDLLDVGGLK